ncbi:mechanosensitive ion channel protein 6-like [Vicia villosa]|uniref:mechanosensitive ion channel protein 6-like n=1 Tax=Vicia villosa TaxID=3911 RepID=UPI00273BBDB1|nr:mechanosensitive ion channel protein 6-like [Vicia villosa]
MSRRKEQEKEMEGVVSFAGAGNSSKYKKRNFGLLILIERLGLVLIPALILTLTLPFLRNEDYWEVSIWKWEIMILFLVSGRLLWRSIIRIIVFWIQRKFQWKIEVLYYVYALKKTVQNYIWLLILYLAWSFWFRLINTDLKDLETALFCFFQALSLWLFKTLIAKVLTTHYHLTTYFGNIEESINNLLWINMLSGSHMVKIQKTKAQEEERRAACNLSNITIERPRSEIEYGGGISFNILSKLNPKFVSSLEMKSLIKTFTYRALDLEDDHSALVTTEKEAKAATEQIFRNIAICGSNSKYIDIEDLMPFMIESQASQIVNHLKGA